MIRKNLVKLTVLAILVVIGLSVSGCVTLPEFSSAQFPNDGAKYVVLGRVEVDVNLLKSGGGFNELLQAAKAKYPKADDVVNVVIDRTVLQFPVTVYTKLKLSGVAIDYVEVK